MLANYLTVFLRLVLKNRLFTLINVAGLAVGLACCCLIALYIRHELTYERMYANPGEVYRVAFDTLERDGSMTLLGVTPRPLADLLQQDFAGKLAEVVRLRPVPALFAAGDVAFHEQNARWVDPAFFSVFEPVWLQGDAGQALNDPASVVITQSTARKYFGNDDAMGQLLTMNHEHALRVSGVVADFPTNTRVSGDIFLSMLIWDLLEPEPEKERPWFNLDYYTFVKLQPGADIAGLRTQLPAFAQRYFPESLASTSIVLEDITKLHFVERLGNLKDCGDYRQLMIFGLIGVAVLGVAVINFVNLSTARAEVRAMEVGLRKSAGAGQAQLVRQFLGEALLLTLLAALFALVLVELFLPQLEAFLGMGLDFSWLDSPVWFLTLACAVVLLAVLAGWYPAVVMTSFSVSRGMRETHARSGRKLALRNLLVVAQFSVAIALIVASSTIYSQMKLLAELDMGFEFENRLVIGTNIDYGSQARISGLQNALLQHPAIIGATQSASSPLRKEFAIETFITLPGDTTAKRFSYVPVDFSYFALYGIDLVAGRHFDPARPADLMPLLADRETSTAGSLLISVGGAREFGWSPQEALGKLVERNGHAYPIIGVVEDIVESGVTGSNPSLYAIPADLNPGTFLTIHIAPGATDATLAFVNEVWREINPGEPLNARFMDARIAELYLDQDKRLQLSWWFTAIAIVLSCMGLYGLATHSAEQRRKEIGVRKVLGGSIWQIVLLLTGDFSRLVLVANVIAWPIAYLAMERWLENFVHRVDLTPLVFVGSGLIALCIAWVTVGGTAAKAAARKPVLALRYE